LPLIIINALANLLTYHLNSRQKQRLYLLKNLDSKIEILEQANRKLLYFTAYLQLICGNESADSCTVATQASGSQSILVDHLDGSSRVQSHTFSFFKQHKINKHLLKNSVSEADINDNIIYLRK
jgi:hypothetical protein